MLFKRKVCEENDFAHNFLYNHFSERPTAARTHFWKAFHRVLGTYLTVESDI